MVLMPPLPLCSRSCTSLSSTPDVVQQSVTSNVLQRPLCSVSYAPVFLMVLQVLKTAQDVDYNIAPAVGANIL